MNASIPPHPRRPPRPLTDAERGALLAVAEVLIPGASEARGIDAWLDRALTARSDVFEDVVASAIRLVDQPGPLERVVRALASEEPERFGPLSQVLAGAYLMVPEVRAAIGYPGQERRPPAFDEAAEQLMSGILDPVVERGPLPDRRAP